VNFPVYQTPPRPPLHHPTISRVTKLDWRKGARIDKNQEPKEHNYRNNIKSTQQHADAVSLTLQQGLTQHDTLRKDPHEHIKLV
jgi:hypothetical protein